MTVKGTAVNLKHQATTQTSPGAAYSVSANGSGTVTFPAPSGVAAANQLLSGTKTLYVSADGNLILGGSATGYDMFLGIKALSGSNPSPLSGVYFTGLLQNDAATNGVGVYASEGAANEVSNTLELAHERAALDPLLAARGQEGADVERAERDEVAEIRRATEMHGEEGQELAQVARISFDGVPREPVTLLLFAPEAADIAMRDG